MPQLARLPAVQVALRSTAEPLRQAAQELPELLSSPNSVRRKGGIAMTTYAVIDGNGMIVNRVAIDDPTQWAPPTGCSIVQEATQVYEIGGTYINGIYTPLPPPPPLPPPVPAAISDRQFFQQLAVQGVITPDDALAAVKTGELPTALRQLVSAMPPDKQFAATMMIAGATVFERYHPLTIAMGTAYGWTAAQIDVLWRVAAEL
jgi:hypothetical protein